MKNSAKRTTALGLALTALPAVRAALTLNGPTQLIACETASYNWTGGAAPYRLNFGSQTSSVELEDSIAVHNYDWQVNYPAGTIINARLDSFAGYGPHYAYGGSMVVQAGSSTACIPSSRRNLPKVADPVTIIPPANLTACEASTWSWSGGTAPYTLNFIALDSAGASFQTTTSDQTYTWDTNFPGGATMYLNVFGTNYRANSANGFSPTQYIYNGTTESCVQAAYLTGVGAIERTSPPPIPSPVVSSSSTRRAPTSTAFVSGNRSTVKMGLSAGAIAGIIVAVVGLLSIYLGYLILRRRQKRSMARNQAMALQSTDSHEKIDEDDVKGKSTSTAASGHTTLPVLSRQAPAVIRRGV